MAEADRRCRVRPEDGLRTARVWEEARKALQTTAWAEEEGIFRYRVHRYVRMLDRDGRVEGEERRTRSGFFRKPFRSLPAETLVRDGFVQQRDEGRFYYAPDAGVLLSDAFLDTHCFRLTPGEGDETGLLGLAFEPVRGGDVPDIGGVLWLDPEASELRHLEFRYTRLGLDIDTDPLRGRVEFERLPTGAWIVRRWWLRTPRIGIQQDPRLASGHRRVLIGVKEDGGEVVRITSAAGDRVLQARLATLEGVVFDSARGRPLAGARVYLSGTEYAARTDSAGRFRITDLGGGRYTLGFTHPRLDSLGVVPPTREVVLRRGRTTETRLAVPSLGTILAAGCDDRQPGDSTAVVVGSVRDAATGVPLGGARVFIRWDKWSIKGRMEDRKLKTTTKGNVQTMEVEADGNGYYRACAVPADETLHIWAQMVQQSGDTITVDLLAEGEVVSRTLTIPLSKPAVIAGRVVTREDGTAVAGATVSLAGTAHQALTDEAGRFRFRDVASGDYLLQVRSLGHGTRKDTIRVPAGDTVDVTVRIATSAVAIDPIEVTVLSSRERWARVQGRPDVALIQRGDIDAYEERGARDLVDVLRMHDASLARIKEMMNGVNPIGTCIELRHVRALPTPNVDSNCGMVMVIVDGVVIATDVPRFIEQLSSDEIERIEVLPPAEATFRFGTTAGNGALVIQTRRGSR